MFSSQTQARVRVSCLIVSRGRRSSSFGNNHPCSAPSMTPRSSLLATLLLLAAFLRTLVEINDNEIKWFIVVWCMMYLSKTRSFSKGRDLAAWRLSKPALQQAAHHQTLWSWLLGEFVGYCCIGGGWDGKNGMIDHLVLTQIAGTTAEPQ